MWMRNPNANTSSCSDCARRWITIIFCLHLQNSDEFITAILQVLFCFLRCTWTKWLVWNALDFVGAFELVSVFSIRISLKMGTEFALSTKWKQWYGRHWHTLYYEFSSGIHAKHVHRKWHVKFILEISEKFCIYMRWVLLSLDTDDGLWTSFQRHENTINSLQMNTKIIIFRKINNLRVLFIESMFNYRKISLSTPLFILMDRKL